MDERIKVYDEKMTKTFNNLLSEFATIRAGRANPSILNKIRVDYYGTPTPLQQIGNITVPEPRILQIQPWEASMVKAIEKAILTSDIGINPSNDGRIIRLVFPELTEERRKDLVKEVKKKGYRHSDRRKVKRNPYGIIVSRDSIQGYYRWSAAVIPLFLREEKG